MPLGNVSHSSAANSAAERSARRSASGEERQWIRIGSPFWCLIVLSYATAALYLLDMSNDKRFIAMTCQRSQIDHAMSFSVSDLFNRLKMNWQARRSVVWHMLKPVALGLLF